MTLASAGLGGLVADHEAADMFFSMGARACCQTESEQWDGDS